MVFAPAKMRKTLVKKKSKKGKKDEKNPLTREDISGKIIKLSGRRAGTKKITYEAPTRMEMDRKTLRKKLKKFLTSRKTCDKIKKFAKANELRKKHEH